MAQSELLSFIVSQVAGHRMKVHKYGKIADRILETNYALS
jgi:hypothetical protein